MIWCLLKLVLVDRAQLTLHSHKLTARCLIPRSRITSSFSSAGSWAYLWLHPARAGLQPPDFFYHSSVSSGSLELPFILLGKAPVSLIFYLMVRKPGLCPYPTGVRSFGSVFTSPAFNQESFSRASCQLPRDPAALCFLAFGRWL